MSNTQTDTEYTTRHVGLASFLRYALGDDAHRRTEKVGNFSTLFIFSDTELCVKLEHEFFNSEGAMVSNARELLDCARAVKMTVAAAQRSETGTWSAEDGL